MEMGEGKLPLLGDVGAEDEELGPVRRVCTESKELWRIVGPAILSRIALYTMNVATQAFAGHLGDLELASTSIATTVIFGFSFGLLGIWAGMIGGTTVQTVILAYLTIRCDWDKEAMKACIRVGEDAIVRRKQPCLVLVK